MDNIDSAYLWAMLSLPALAIVLTYLLRSRYNELIALHLAVFWTQFFAYGWVWLLGQPSFRFPGWIMLLLGFELTVYSGAFVVLAGPMRRFVNTVSGAALEVLPRMLLLWITLSMGAYLYIISTYGVLVLIPTADVAESAGMPSYLTYLNGLLAVPAWGGVFCCCIRLAYRRFHPIQLVALAYVLMHMLVEGNGGKRQILLVVAVVALFGLRRPLRITWRAVAGVMATACVLFVMWGLYEGVRNNLRDILFVGQRYDSGVDLIEALVTPPKERRDIVGAVVEKNLQTRTAPIWLLEQLAEQPNLAGGAFISQSFQNVIPSAFGKTQTLHENDILSDKLDFPSDDQPWTMLNEMQAETSAFAALLTPLLYVGLFWLYWSVIARWRGRSDMLMLVAIGIVVFEAGEVQTTLTATLVYLRTLSIYLAFGSVLWHLRQNVRPIASSPRVDRLPLNNAESARSEYRTA